MTSLACVAQASGLVKPEIVIYPQGMTPEVLQTVSKALDAVIRTLDDEDTKEAMRVRFKARDAVVSALRIHGYYNARVDLIVGTDAFGETWEVSVNSGPPAKVYQVNQHFSGAVSLPQFSERLQKIKDQWPLNKGDVFVNDNWSKAKSDTLTQLSQQDFYYARMIDTQAIVNTSNQRVILNTSYDSGPAVKLGTLQIEGLNRVPERLIHRYVRYSEGDPYDANTLSKWQQQLMSTEYFRGVFIFPDAQVSLNEQEVTVPLKVKVTEGPSKQITANVGWTDDVGPKAELLYKQYILFHSPLTLNSGIGVDKTQQKVFLDVYKPPNLDGTVDSFGTLFNHYDNDGEDVKRFALGWKRTHEFKLDERSRVLFNSEWGARLNYDWVTRDNDDKYSLPTVVATWTGMRRDVDDIYNPTRGNLVAIGLGAGIAGGSHSHRPFTRMDLRYQYWFSLSPKDIVTIRAQAGQVFADDQVTIPYDFGYRLGGARTLRGYRYEQFGQEIGDGVTVGAKAMMAAGVEYIHYFNDMLGMSTFIDMGNTARYIKDVEPVLGYGIGAVAKTPAGPFELQFAWGQKDRKLRIHFSLGMAF
ncbi:hypothetical protein IX83_03230 [Basilea psittacipulmonis DSM 24701]|uniref:Translocation and assembly module subunit TamA n=1 Tax=Basilea psittacipulmonis DSM 24701 TaxID=1072685 RepID=A0A077DGZ1_9BURK|nr:hypothetical protein IX83_03230 [Basilea psittacipulmonis DSM 24701]